KVILPGLRGTSTWRNHKKKESAQSKWSFDRVESDKKVIRPGQNGIST
ncbi:hypothetical protein BSG1_21825, partial [Bacillus sp. SG-1]